MRIKLPVVALALIAGPVAAAPPVHPVVQVESGQLAGTDDGATIAFRGIPYAAAPVGPLRWRAPMPPAAWSGTRDASHYGAACPQAPDHHEPWAQVGPTSEDCLFLNVWRPAHAGRYPVMVFVHGGGFTYGSAGVPLYDGAKLARRGVVLVSLNYRLGRLGYFAHPALTRENPAGPLGNYGTMDQIAALQWVRRNIAAFGGDPSNVTLFGESAGAGAVQTLMGTPAAAGLFQKAISESGAGGAVLMPIGGHAASAEALGARWAEGVGLKDATAGQLRALPVDKLLGRSFPFIDGQIAIDSPGAPFARGSEAKIPLLIGANSNEATLFGTGEAATRKLLGDRYDAHLKAYVAARPDKGAGAVAIDLAEDALSIQPSISIAVMHAANGAQAYDYYFNQVPANLRAGSAGTPHGGELEYVFGNPDAGSVWDAADRAVSDAIAEYWVRFARTGNPNGAGNTPWPGVSASGRPAYLSIGTPIRASQVSVIQDDVRKQALAVAQAGWTQKR